MKTFECPGNKKPREISKEILMIKPDKDLFTKRNQTDSNFVAGPVRETIIACLSSCFPPKYYQSILFFKFKKIPHDASNFYMASS